MATNGNRDVVLTVEAKARGAGEIEALATKVRGLGKTGGDAAPEFDKLADELDRLAEQSGAVVGLKALETEVQALAAAQERAANAAKAAADTYAKQKAENDALRASVAAATDAWNEARKAQAGAREALQQTGIELESLTAKEKAQNVSLKTAKLESAAATNETRQRKIALDEAKQALAGVTAEESKAEAAQRKTASALQATESALKARTAALTEAQGAAGKLGVEIDDLAAAEARLNAGIVDTVAAANAEHKAIVALSEAVKQQQRATQALDGIRRAAAQLDGAAQIKAETAALAQQEKATQALANIRRIAYQQDNAAKIEAEAAALKGLNAQQVQAERIQTALANIRRIAYQQDNAAKIEAEAAALKKLEAAAEAAAQALPKAFNQAGVRSIQAIQAEIGETTAALRALEAAQKAGAISATDLARATGSAQARLQALSAEIRTMPAATGALERMNDTVLGLVNRFGALSAAVATVGFAAAPIIQANIQLDSMRRVLTQVFGSAQAAGEQIDFVRRVAESAGIDVAAAGASFTRFASSAKASGLNTDLVRQVFEATANAAGNLGLSSDKTSLILDALGQMANKGVVSMEELRQQLGDSLPGALSLLAKGLKITEPELVKLVESGKLLTSQALGPLAEAMGTLGAPGGRVDGLGASLARLRSQFTLALQSVSDTAGYRLFGQVVEGVANNFGTLTTGVKLLTEAFLVSKVVTVTSNFIGLRLATTATAVATVEATAAVVAHTVATGADTAATAANTAAKTANAAATGAAALATGRNAGAWAAVGEGLAAMTPKAAQAAQAVTLLARAKDLAAAGASRLLGALGGPIGATITFALVAKDLAAGLASVTARMLGYGDRTDEITTKLKAAEAAHRKNAEAMNESAEGWVQATVRYSNALGPLEKNIEASGKLLAAKRLEGEASVRVAELSGVEAAKLDAVSVATAGNAEAARQAATDKGALVGLTEGLLAAYDREEKAKGKLSAAEAQVRDELRATLGVQRAAADEAVAFADAQLAAAESSRQAAATYRDNSGRVLALQIAYQQAAESVDLMTAAHRRGEASQASVTAATERAGKAQGLYRDALRDGIAAGVDFRQIQTGVSDEFFRSTEGLHGVITSLAEYKTEAAKASPVLTEAFDKRIAAAKTKEELEFVTAEIKRARDAGLLFGTDFEAVMLRAKVAAEKLSPAIRQAMIDAATLGITLKDKVGGGADAGVAQGVAAFERMKAGGVASTAEIGKAFVGLATKAIEANQGIVPEWVKVEAAIRGATIQIDAQGKAVVIAADLTLKNTTAMAAGFGRVTQATKEAEDAALRYGSVLKQTQYDADKFALGEDGNRVAAGDGTLDPLYAKKAQTGAQAKFDNALAASQLANDKVSNYNKYFLTTGVTPKTTAARKTLLRQEAQAAFDEVQIAAAELEAAKAASKDAGSRANAVDLINAGASGTAGALTGAEAKATPTAGSTTHRVTITLPNGSTGTVNAASASDAANLAALLSQLQQGAARAGG